MVDILALMIVMYFAAEGLWYTTAEASRIYLSWLITKMAEVNEQLRQSQ